MNADENRSELNKLSGQVLRCALTVSNTLGSGFVEKVYENALAKELRKAGLKVQQQQPIRVLYDGEAVGDLAADLLVGNCLLVELKATSSLNEVYIAQCYNYLRGTGLKLCLLLNFGTPRLGIKRVVYKF